MTSCHRILFVLSHDFAGEVAAVARYRDSGSWDTTEQGPRSFWYILDFG